MKDFGTMEDFDALLKGLFERHIKLYERLGFKNVMDSTFEYKGGEGKVAMMKMHENDH